MKIPKLFLSLLFLCLYVFSITQTPLIVKEVNNFQQSDGAWSQGVERYYAYNQSGERISKRDCFYDDNLKANTCITSQEEKWTYNKDGKLTSHHHLNYHYDFDRDDTLVYNEDQKNEEWHYNSENLLEGEVSTDLYLSYTGDTLSYSGSRSLHFYNSAGCLTETILERIEQQPEDRYSWIVVERKIYQTNADCSIKFQDFQWYEDNEWKNIRRDEYSYENGLLSQKKYFYFSNSGTWVENVVFNYTYNAAGQLTEETKTPNDTSESSSRAIKEYNSSGLLISDILLVKGGTLDWVETRHKTYEYNSADLLTRSTSIFRYGFEDPDRYSYYLTEKTYEYNAFQQLEYEVGRNEIFALRDSIMINRKWEDIYTARCDGYATEWQRNYLEWSDPCNPGSLPPPRGRILMTYNQAPACEEAKEYQLNVYPNPTTGPITIESELIGLPQSRLQIYSSSGQAIIDQFSAISLRAKADLSHLPNGIYFIRIQNGKEQVSQQVLLNNN